MKDKLNFLLVENSICYMQLYLKGIAFAMAKDYRNIPYKIYEVSSPKEFKKLKLDDIEFHLSWIAWVLDRNLTSEPIIRNLAGLCKYLTIITVSPSDPKLLQVCRECDIASIISKSGNWEDLHRLLKEALVGVV